ncbi:MAG: phage head closure protein [Ruminococcus flavefaciens]|nr:phage head closure protein [Ruminococcus flavefaciens]
MIYNKKIIFQIITEKADEIGSQSPEWTDFFTAWANVNSIGGREYYTASQVNSQNDVIFKVRYSRKIAGFLTSEIRILYNGNIYDIKHIDDYQEQHRQLVFRTEVHNGGHN